MLYRFFRFIVLVIIFFGVGLTLLGLFGSLRQAVGGVVGLLNGDELVGQASVLAKSIPVSGPAPTRTPFQPLRITATPQALARQTQARPSGSKAGAASAVNTRPTASITPSPTPTVKPIGAPDRIVIERIGLDAPVVIIPRLELVLGHDIFEHWQPPSFFAAGWHEGSAFLGEKGNTVLSGHHNIDGMVFGGLLDLRQGDRITVYAGELPYHYVVSQVMKFEERYVPVEQRVLNAHWILPSTDERLTLVTCWPPDSNTYRLIVVAVPTDP